MTRKRAKKKRLARFAVIFCAVLLVLAITALIADTGLSVSKI